MTDVLLCHGDKTAGAREGENHADKKSSFIRRFISAGALRFAGWWSIFAGLLAMNSVCPVCGSQACPVGIGTTGIIAALFAAVKQWGGGVFRLLRGLFMRVPAPDNNKKG